jgi:hypothetical protein
MKRLFFLILLIFVGIGAWRISERLSADAIGMALGVLFGVLAGIPVALLVLASARRREQWPEEGRTPPRGAPELTGHGYPMQPPVIVLAGPGYHPQMPPTPGNQAPGRMLLQAQHDTAHAAPGERRFKVVGEQEEWIEEW